MGTTKTSDASPTDNADADANASTGRPMKKARRESCKVDMIHHVWLQLPGASGPSPLNMECMASWEPMPQRLWVSHELGEDEAAWLAIHCPSLQIRPVSNVFSMHQIAGWLSSNIPVQIVKDMVSMAILAACGGLFADLDIYWLGKQPGNFFQGNWFHLEPHPSAGRRFSRLSDRVTLAILAMPKDSAVANELLQSWKAFWSSYAVGQVTSAEQTNWDSLNVVTGLWMRNTNDLHKKIGSQLHQAIQQPIVAIPWPKNLTMACTGCIVSGQVDNHASRATLDYAQAYPLPSLKTVAKFTIAVNLWVRQWKEPVTAWALKALRAVRAKALSMPETCPYIPGEGRPPETPRQAASSSTPSTAPTFTVREQDLESLHHLLSPVIGFAKSHKLMATVYAFLATDFAKTSLSRMASEGQHNLDLASGIVLYCARTGTYDQCQLNAAFGNRLQQARWALQAFRKVINAQDEVETIEVLE